MRYQTILAKGDAAHSHDPPASPICCGNRTKSEKLAWRTHLQYWQGVPRDQEVQYDPNQFAEYPTSPEEKQNIVERLKELHRQLRERLQTREGKMSPETHELAQQTE
jgi:hypothetical protein